MSIDLAEGRRLLDALHNDGPADTFWQRNHDALGWLQDNAEAMLTLLERARVVMRAAEWVGHSDDQGEWAECPACGGSLEFGHFPRCRLAGLLHALTATDAGDPLSLLELENLP